MNNLNQFAAPVLDADDSAQLAYQSGNSSIETQSDVRQGSPLAGSVRVSQSPELAAKLRKLSELSIAKGLLALGGDWAVIAGCFALALAFPHWSIWLVAALVIATRQHALLILMHDASHYRLLHHRRWNDRLGNWFMAWPLLVTTEGYRQNHLPHHFHLNTDRDPDWMRKKDRTEWTFPKTRTGIALLLLRDLLGGGFIDALRSIASLSGSKDSAEAPRRFNWSRPAYYFGGAILAIVTGLWPAVLLLWFLPAFTLLTVILRVRSIAEHFGVEGENELNSSRNLHGSFFERLLLTPHHCGFHLDHHLFPSVPFYNLPLLHQALLAEPAYAIQAHQTEGFIRGSGRGFLAEISTPRPQVRNE
jgi:fatty acid desaturase